jgi:hypothetical protein
MTPPTLSNRVIVFSGFRDENLSAKIANRGGVVKTSMVKDTNLLLYKKDGKPGSKIDLAKQRGIEIMDLDTFMQKYFKSSNANANAKANVTMQKKPSKAQYFDLSMYEANYESRGYQPPFAVKDIETIVKTKLYDGDIINFGTFRQQYSWIVNSSSLVSSQSDEGYMNIPLTVTEKLSSALDFYSELIDNGDVESIDLSRNDVFIKKIFKVPSELWRTAKFTYIPSSENLLVNDTLVSRPFTSKKIEAALVKKQSCTFYVKAILVVNDQERDYTLQINPTTLKKIFGSKVKFQKGFGSSVEVEGDLDYSDIDTKLISLKI